MHYKLEVIAFNIESCHIAEASKVDRVELCDNAGDGGTTPSYGFIKAARKIFSRELYPIIRPRGGDFLYSDAAFSAMKADIKICKDMDCDGIVFGILLPDGSVDKRRCGQLVELAYPLEVTFHRAFDRTNKCFQAMEDLIDIGCERILTSGQFPTAIEGARIIGELVRQAGERIIIMPGSGVRAENIVEIATKTGAVELHSSARSTVKSKMKYVNPNMKESTDFIALDAAEIASMRKQLEEI